MKLATRLLFAAFVTASVLQANPSPGGGTGGGGSNVPDTGSSIGMIAVGLVVLTVLRRKFSK